MFHRFFRVVQLIFPWEIWRFPANFPFNQCSDPYANSASHPSIRPKIQTVGSLGNWRYRRSRFQAVGSRGFM
jgi:hypothetical protein